MGSPDRQKVGFGPINWHRGSKEPPMYWGIGATKKDAATQAAQRTRHRNTFWFRLGGSYDEIPDGTVYELWGDPGTKHIHGKADNLQYDQEHKKLTVTDAILAWETDTKRNPEGNKIVRGRDGKPVEIVLVKKTEKPVWAIRLNGENREQFQIGGEMQSIEQALGNLRFNQFINGNLFDKWYELKGIQRLDAQVSNEHQGFVFGFPGKQPDSLQVSFRGA